MPSRLIWEETFSVDGRPDPSLWNIASGGTGFGNNEDQCYTDRPENVFVKDGVLHLVARKEAFGNRSYTSAKLTTAGKRSVKCGRLEVEAKLPAGKGTWPAIWLLGDDIRQVGWPKCGEIDLMEHVGKNPGHVHFSLHSQAYNHLKNNQPTRILHHSDLFGDFHRFAMEWDEGGFAFYLDGRHAGTMPRHPGDTRDEWPFDQGFYLILNLAIGGTWGGEIDDSIFPVEFQIRAIRAYEKE